MGTAILSDRAETSILNNNRTSRRRKNIPNHFVFGKRVGLVAKLFGCWHENLSRPFTQEHIAYRSCLHCGARKQFNAETLETYGSFYFPPVVREERNFVS